MDQQDEIRQMQVEANIVRLLNALYKDLQLSDRPEAEDHLGHIAEMKAFWEGDAGSKDTPPTKEMAYEGDPCADFIDEEGECVYLKCDNKECPYKKEVSK